jgi:hypothetical protein
MDADRPTNAKVQRVLRDQEFRNFTAHQIGRDRVFLAIGDVVTDRRAMAMVTALSERWSAVMEIDSRDKINIHVTQKEA